MAMHAFRRLREQQAASREAAFSRTDAPSDTTAPAPRRPRGEAATRKPKAPPNAAAPAP